MKLPNWPLMDGLLHLLQREGLWAEPQPAQAPPRCTKSTDCSVPITDESPAINDGPLLCGFNVRIKGLTSSGDIDVVRRVLRRNVFVYLLYTTRVTSQLHRTDSHLQYQLRRLPELSFYACASLDCAEAQCYFTARRVCTARSMPSQDVCLSVRLSVRHTLVFCQTVTCHVSSNFFTVR